MPAPCCSTAGRCASSTGSSPIPRRTSGSAATAGAPETAPTTSPTTRSTSRRRCSSTSASRSSSRPSNSGGPNTLNQYATSPWVVSVAASDKQRNLADFSSRGRIGGNWDRAHAQATNTGIYRPTLTAPGVAINAAKSALATLMAPGVDPENPFYTSADGTSMATPHVAGAIALMLDARERLGPQHVIAILEGTADDMPAYEVFEVGAGHLDAWEAVRAAERGKTRFPPDAGADAHLHRNLVGELQRDRAAAEHVGPGTVPGHDRPAEPPHLHRHGRHRRDLHRDRAGAARRSCSTCGCTTRAARSPASRRGCSTSVP